MVYDLFPILLEIANKEIRENRRVVTSTEINPKALFGLSYVLLIGPMKISIKNCDRMFVSFNDSKEEWEFEYIILKYHIKELVMFSDGQKFNEYCKELKNRMNYIYNLKTNQEIGEALHNLYLGILKKQKAKRQNILNEKSLEGIKLGKKKHRNFKKFCKELPDCINNTVPKALEVFDMQCVIMSFL